MARLNLNNPSDFDYFLTQAKYAGQEIITMVNRLGKSRAFKAQLGLYSGGNIPTGYIVDFDEKSETYEHFLEYPPHSKIIPELFLLALKHGCSTVKVIRECRNQNIYFPLFDPEIAKEIKTRTGLRLCKQKKDASGNVIGYEINKGLLQSIFSNPSYIGLPVRSGKILKDGLFPAIVDPDLFAAVYEKITSAVPKRRGKIEKTEPHALQGIIYSECMRGSIRPLHFSSDPRISAQKYRGAQGMLRCGCGDIYPELGACYHISAHVILNPVQDYVLSQIAFPEFVESVTQAIQDDYNGVKMKADSFKRERKRLMDEISNLRSNFSHIRMDGPMAEMMQQDLEKRMEDLKDLEKRQMEAYNATNITSDDVSLIKGFLSDLRTKWDHLPPAFHNRLFKLLLSKVIVHSLSDNNFHVEVYWKGGVVQKLWIERPPMSTKCKAWSEDEKSLLCQLYTNASVEEILSHFPDKNWDAVRSGAQRMNLKRENQPSPVWTATADDVILRLSKRELTFRQARFLLRQYRQSDILKKLAKLGIENFATDTLNWHLISGNTQDNELCSPTPF